VKQVFAIMAACLLLACAAAQGKRTATAPATPPAVERSPQPGSAGPAAASGAEARRLAARIAGLGRRFLALAKAGKYAQCRSILGEILRIDPTHGTAWYNMACVHCRLGAPDEAMSCLNKALEHGYSDFRHLARDGDLEPLRGLQAYDELLKRNQEIQRARAEKMQQALRQQFGDGYIVEVDHPSRLVLATDMDRQMLDELKAYLTAYAEAQWADLFTHRFEQYVTVVVPCSGSVALAGATGGYYTHPQRLLLAGQTGMVLTHEFTHALHDADQDGLGQRHPMWIAEGLATLFESSIIADGHVLAEPNHRLNLLKSLIAGDRNIPWKDFVRYDQARFMTRVIASYPQCRYMMMYLYENGLLKRWYDAYTAGYEEDPTGAEALEQVFGKTLDEVEADWLAWVRKQKSPPVRLAVESAYIGVRTQGQADGLRVLEVVPGSGADKAALKPGDVIVNVDGRRVVSPAAMLRLVSRHIPGDEIEVRFRRSGQYGTVTVTLGKWAGEPPAAQPAKDAPQPPPAEQAPAPPARKAA